MYQFLRRKLIGAYTPKIHAVIEDTFTNTQLDLFDAEIHLEYWQARVEMYQKRLERLQNASLPVCRLVVDQPQEEAQNVRISLSESDSSL
jgi:hypothetical protein